MKITLDNTTKFFTKKRIITIIIAFVIYCLYLELFMQPCSKFVCKNNVCTMYSRTGLFNKNILEYSFKRSDISEYKIQKHGHIRSGARYQTHRHDDYSVVLILKNNQTIHLPYYFGEGQVKDFYQELNSNKDIIKFATYYVYRFE